MKKVRLGKTEMMVTKTSFGALPIQRISFDESAAILRRAYEAGVNFFDTANMYTDSEAKIGYALSDVRKDIIIATKSAVCPIDQFKANLENSLKQLRTDYIDLFQLHNPAVLPDPEEPGGIYQYLEDMKRQGVIRHIGVTNHRPPVAMEAIQSGLYETLQFPFSVLAIDKDLELVEECRRHDLGFIAMKAMSGGLIREPKATFAFLQKFDNVVPIYGIQRMSELEEWLGYDADPPVWDEEMERLVAKERADLAGNFCRGCGYCMPCPAGIQINTAARISLLLTRSPYKPFLSKEWRANMDKINNCLHCGHCTSRCPFGLNTPELLVSELAKYNAFYEEHLDEAER